MYNISAREKKVQNKAILKWEENDIVFNENDWYQIFELALKKTKESKFHWLQFQILHRILLINSYLHKLIDSSNCSFCNQESETIGHLFVECPIVKELGSNIEELFLKKLQVVFIVQQAKHTFW